MAFSDVVLLKPPVPKKGSSDVVLLGSFSLYVSGLFFFAHFPIEKLEYILSSFSNSMNPLNHWE